MDIVGILISLIFVIYINFYFSNQLSRILEFDVVVFLVFIIFIYLFLKHFTYKLEIVNDEIIETSLFAKEKKIKISDIKNIERGYYSLFSYSRSSKKEKKSFFINLSPPFYLLFLASN